MRLKAGQAAPDFSVTDINDGVTAICLKNFVGHKLLLSFHRYAACPLCNLHIHELSKNYPFFAEHNLRVLALFQSTAERTRDQYGSRKVPFHIAVDPEAVAYNAYGIEYSTAGMLASFIHPRAAYAFFSGNMPGKIDADVRILPADFLIDEKQTIQKVYYSSNITQHLSLSEIRTFAKS